MNAVTFLKEVFSDYFQVFINKYIDLKKTSFPQKNVFPFLLLDMNAINMYHKSETF